MILSISSRDPLDPLPASLRALYDRARDAYLTGDHKGALEFDKELQETARATKSPLGEILGLRFMGLCFYRLGQLDRSAEHFRAALDLAERTNHTTQALLISNHLASTVRRQGKLGEAYRLLTAALERAALPEHVHAHARLVGNLGALLDELGQRAHADDCYARFEVLTELLGNPHRLANARGLAARAAERRDDLDIAEKKYRQERQLAVESRDPLRQIAATLHTARLSARRERLDEAEQLFREALVQTESCTYEKRRIDALEFYADFLHNKRRDLPRAFFYLGKAAELAQSEPEKKALVAYRTALVCRDAGLLGESLFHLMRSVETRHAIYTNLDHDHVRDMAKRRIHDLREITAELVEEAHRVGRSGAEARELEALVVSVHGKDVWRELAKRLQAAPGQPVWSWQKQARRAAEACWERRLPPPAFQRLDGRTQDGLVRAELSYSGAIDDLGRSAQLLALAVECELRQRIFDPARKRLKIKEANPSKTATHLALIEPRECTLGTMLTAIGELVAPTPASDRDLLGQLRKLLGKSLSPLQQVTRLNDPLRPVKGKQRRLLDIRNAIAHDLTTDLSRLEVDAITRTLTLEIQTDGEPSLLAALAQIQL